MHAETKKQKHTQKKKRYLAVISHTTRLKEFNRKKNSNKNIE
jgi:sulfur transfer protein SufE